MEIENNVVEQTAPVVNPLDELGAAVEEFKLKIKAMFDESTALSRKVKEVALIQKQKERDFILCVASSNFEEFPSAGHVV